MNKTRFFSAKMLKLTSKIGTLSTIPKLTTWNLKNILNKNDAIEFSFGDNQKKITFPLIWLRDHCLSSESYNFSTNQRKSKFTNMISLAKIDSSDQVTVSDQNILKINWNDGHQTHFELKYLLEIAFKKSFNLTSNIELWNGETLKKIPTIDRNLLDFSKFSQSLAKYGLIIIENVEKSAVETEKLCKSLVPIHDTFFGQFWVFSNESKFDPSHEDTAYGNEHIGPHTDGTYLNQSPGIQVFHCLKPAESGGETILVDGFNCAKILQNEDSESFEILTKFKIDHQYLEKNQSASEENSPLIYSLSTEKSVIELDSNNEIVQIRFNPYDRAPLRFLTKNGNLSELESRNIIKFYEAYEKFSKICHDPRNFIKISLQPGSVIFIDNFRVLHSRTEFKGYRKMCGCYLSRDNFYAKARPFLSN